MFYYDAINITTVGFILTVANDFCWFLSQCSTSCHDILQALFPTYSDAAPTLKKLVDLTCSSLNKSIKLVSEFHYMSNGLTSEIPSEVVAAWLDNSVLRMDWEILEIYLISLVNEINVNLTI